MTIAQEYADLNVCPETADEDSRILFRKVFIRDDAEATETVVVFNDGSILKYYSDSQEERWYNAINPF